jgi:hypothetical protein
MVVVIVMDAIVVAWMALVVTTVKQSVGCDGQYASQDEDGR